MVAKENQNFLKDIFLWTMLTIVFRYCL